MAVATRLYQNYVNGRFVSATGEKTLTVENPATGAAVSNVPDSSVEDAREAIEFADKAQRKMGEAGPDRARERPAQDRRGDPHGRRAPRPGPFGGAGQAPGPGPG